MSSTMRNVFFLLLIALLFSCAKKLVEKPDNLIDKEKMVEILNDMAILTAAKSTNISILRNNSIEPMQFIYEKHGVDSIQFVESNFYYASLPIEYEAIYTAVEARLEKDKERIEEKKNRNDSIKNMKRKAARDLKKIKDSLP